jgi:acyl dehydratase
MVDKNWAGKKLADFEFTVERVKVKEFADAICDPNPIYKDREYAKSKGIEDVLMPVTFPATCLQYEGPLWDAMKKLEVDQNKGAHGEFEVIYERPVCAGETLRGEMVIGDIYSKAGKRGGAMTFIEMKFNFYDRNNKLVVATKNIMIEKE